MEFNMNENVLLSVVIPVYNTEKYFKKCLDSVIIALKKTNVKYEIIVINDGSEGNIEEIIKGYLNKYNNFIRYVSQENKGRGATRNIGIDASKGKYIHFVDSDDYVSENIYEEMVPYIVNGDIDVVICDFQSICYNSPERNCYVSVKNHNIKDIRLGCFDELILPACWNKIIKKELFNENNFPEEINYEDLATIPLIMLEAKSIQYIPKALYNYVSNENSIMNEKFGLGQLNIIVAMEIACKKINNKINKNDAQIFQYMLFTRRYFEEILEKISFVNKNRKELLKEFCNKAKYIDNILWKNKYFITLLKIQKKDKSIALIHRAIQKNKFGILNIFLRRKMYYRYFAIKYKSLNEGELN